MIVLGVLLLLGGAGCFYYGDQLNSNMEAQLRSIFSKGQGNPGTIFITVGIVLAVIGVILIIAGIVQKASSNRQPAPPANTAPPARVNTQYLIKIKCPHCGALNDQSIAFCTKCGYDFGKQQPKNNPTSWTCSCGKTNSHTDMFCGQCGQKKPDTASAGYQIPRQ